MERLGRKLERNDVKNTSPAGTELRQMQVYGNRVSLVNGLRAGLGSGL